MTAPSMLPPASVEDCLLRIAAVQHSLPKRLRQCADYITANRHRIAISTVADVAMGADVPPSAVMRFCQVFGFSGFSEMQKLFRDAHSAAWPDYATRLANLKSGGAGSPTLLLAEFIEAGRLSLEGLAKSVDEAALTRAVSLLTRADMLHVIGLRRAFPVAGYLAYVFEKMSVPAVLHDGVGRLDHTGALRAGDAVIAISFAPYSGETVDLAAQAMARAIPVLAITDHLASPLARQSSAALYVDEVDFGNFRALSATLVLAMTLAVAVGSARAAQGPFHPPSNGI